MQHSEWAESVNQALEQAYASLMDSKENIDALGDFVADLVAVKQAVAVLYEEACAQLAQQMGEQPEVVTASGAILEKRTGAPRKQWNHKDLAGDVAHRIIQMATDMDTGEVIKTTEEMLGEMLDYAAVSYWRVKNLARIGIVADEYCELGEPKTSIIVRGSTTPLDDNDL